MSSMRRILVVEDELIVARDIQQQLIELDYDPVGHTTRGEQAIRMAGELRPDLVLMDVRLAGAVDGIAAAQAIRQQHGLPVVFLTAYATDDTLARAKLAEPFGYVLKPFTERDLRTALEIALHKHATEARLQDKTRQLTALSHRVLEQQEAQRSQMAHELHEQLGQALTAIKINLQSPAAGSDGNMVDREREALRIVDDSLQWIRRMAMGLRPSMLDDFGLVSALWWLGEKTAGQHALNIRFRLPASLPRSDSRLETACFRIVEQIFANLVRHAHASRIHVYLYLHDGTLVMGVRDNGIGWDAGVDSEVDQCLVGLQERAAQVGGTLSIRARPGLGCSVRLRCPWPLPLPAARTDSG
jgi:signal transduction histidine kinase